MIELITGRGAGLRLGQVADDPRTIVEPDLVGADLHDADDAVVDVQAVHREGVRLHVAHDLLGRLAGLREHVDLGRARRSGR